MSEETLAMLDWDPFAEASPTLSVRWGPSRLHVGDRVRLSPRGRADVMDLALRGRTARVVSLERDYEDKVHVAVVVEDDPGIDLGLLRQPGHRFFFALDDLDPVGSAPS